MIAKYLTTLLANGCTFEVKPVPDFKPISGAVQGTYVELTIDDGQRKWAVAVPPDLELQSALERSLWFFIRERNWPLCERL